MRRLFKMPEFFYSVMYLSIPTRYTYIWSGELSRKYLRNEKS
jgi:hypothetical protein